MLYLHGGIPLLSSREAFAPHAGASGSDPAKQAAEILSRPIVPNSSDMTKRAQGFQDFQQLTMPPASNWAAPNFRRGDER